MLSRKVLYRCYELTHDIVAGEKSLLADQVRKAALIADLSIIKALDSSKKKTRRKNLAKARKAYVIVDAGLEIFLELGWVTGEQLTTITGDLQLAFNGIRRLRRE